jgi:predicted membrane-bound spermidine synthase
MRSSTARLYSVLFFFSGATGLVYELLWVRLLYESFGSTIESVATVVAAYMGGLGLGAWWLGRRADRHPHPAALYGTLEIAIGAFGVASPLALGVAHRAYLALASAWQPGFGASVALRFSLAALVLLVPTTLMGGTLPVLTRAFAGTDRAAVRPALARLYGLNTLGAVVGTALTGFVLTERLGIRASLWAAALTNLGLGVIALVRARSLAPVALAVPDAPLEGPAPEAGASPPWLRPLALVLLPVTAFTALLSEIAWTRLLVMIVGGSTYAFTLVLLVFLLGIGLGSALTARWGRGSAPRDVAAAAAVALGVTAVGSALVFLSAGILPEYIVLVFGPEYLGATGRLVLLGGAAAAVVLLPALGMGMTFPLLTDLATRERAARAADVGTAYWLNTLGGIAGSTLAGFVLIAAYGTEGTLRGAVLVSVAATLALTLGAALGVAEGSSAHRRLRSRVLGAGVLAGIGLTLAVVAPGWGPRALDLSPAIYVRGPLTPTARRAFLQHRGSRQLAFAEGRNATVSVWESETGRTLNVNGKVDASDDVDMDTQVMLGLAPLAARPDPRAALVIGYGSGVTVRVVAQTPGMARVRVVEIEPVVLGMSPFFERVNDSALARPGVSVVVDDARSALQLDTARYDVVISEPSNPWLAGVPTLYTPEFFQIVRARLAPGGVFCQWVQTYQLPLGVVAAIVRNVAAVFPHLEVWFGGPGDLVVMGSAAPLRYDPGWLERLFAPGSALHALAGEYLGVDGPEDFFGRRLLGDDGAARLAARATVVHRDDRPGLEFVAARRFLDPRVGVDLFDSLVALGASAGRPDTARLLSLARALGRAPWNPFALRYVGAAHQLAPDDPTWTAMLAELLVARGERAFADSVVPRLVRRRDPALALLGGELALARGETARAHVALDVALGEGADTASTRADLAVIAARERRWGDAAREVRAALAATRGTLRHPDPRATLGEALQHLALEGPPAPGAALLGEAVARRPGWAMLHELHGLAALRAGACDAGRDEFLELLQFGIEVDDGPALVERCRRGETP